mgnify:CR=1 FL=1
MKKLLILGGKPIGSTEIVQAARKKGVYTVVADYLPETESPAKTIADEPVSYTHLTLPTIRLV